TVVENVAQPLNRYTGLLEAGPELSQANDGLRHPPCKHVEGDQFAHCKLAIDEQERAQPPRADRDQFGYQADALIREIGKVLGLEACRHIGGQLTVPTPTDL